MTLQQLRYVTAIAETGTLSEAARRLYIAQPSLTAALHELETELGLTIFRRTNRGAVLTPEGEEFLGYARQVLAQMDLIEEKHLGAAPVKQQFCVSTQHYSFAVEAFVELLREYGGPEYDFRIRKTQTYELIEDVADSKKVVLGLITTKSPRLEDKAAVIARIHEAEKYIPLDRLALSPQCGFASCEIGNKLTDLEQWNKLKLVKEITEEVWGK